MKKFVDSYCNYLKKRGIIVSDEQLEICAYGLELIVSAILNIVILVMCSFVLHEERYILFYFLGFIPLRLFAGGYHADNHLNCCIIFAGIYVVSVFLRCIAEPPLVLCFIVVETLLILLLSPVESVNKQITSKRRRISRNRSIWILLANVVVCIVETKKPEKSRQKAAGCRNTQEVIYTQPLFITPFYLLKGYRSDRLDINIPVIPKAARRDGFTR